MRVTMGRMVAVEAAATAPNSLRVMAEGMAVPPKFPIEVAVIKPTMWRPHQPVRWVFLLVQSELATPIGMSPAAEPAWLIVFIAWPKIPAWLSPSEEDIAVLLKDKSPK